MTRRAALLAVLAAPVFGFGAARAQGIDLSGGGPVAVTARGGFEWRENQQMVIASGDARAVRGDVTVLADELVAHYRKKNAVGGTPSATPATAAGEPDSGGNEVYRLEAHGHVRIVTPTDEAVGDDAVYDIDQAVLVMTGHAMKLTTPQDVLTARDSMEYWSQRHMSVGRGNAVVVTSDGRRLSADVLVGFTVATPGVATAAARPGDPLGGNSKLERVEAYGNVEVRTQVDTVRGDRGVYVPETGVARIVGHVRVTHGQNQLNGPAADVNMKTGIAHIISAPGQRVNGLIMPNTQESGQGAAPTGKPAGKPAAAP